MPSSVTSSALFDVFSAASNIKSSVERFTFPSWASLTSVSGDATDVRRECRSRRGARAEVIHSRGRVCGGLAPGARARARADDEREANAMPRACATWARIVRGVCEGGTGEYSAATSRKND